MVDFFYGIPVVISWEGFLELFLRISRGISGGIAGEEF